MKLRIPSPSGGLFARLCGWCAAYVAVGGALGFGLARHYAPFRLFADGFHPPPYCLPEKVFLEFIQSRCEYGIFDALWFLAAGLPRLLIGGVGWALALTVDPANWGVGSSGGARLILLDGAAAGVVIVYALGVRAWHAGSPRVALSLGAAGAGQVGLFLYDLYSI